MRSIIRSASRLRAHAVTQLAVTGLLSALVGFTLQITKLSALDSSGRQFDQSTYAGKVSFLAVFGISKAFANLSVGWLVTRLGYSRTELGGWLLGLAMPLLLALAAAGGNGDSDDVAGGGGGASGASGWRAVMAANVVLGLQQGLCWSVTVLVMILLMPATRRGLASGLNETLGYVAVASAAPVYGILESRFVRCGWVLPPPQLSATCQAATVTALPAPALSALGGGAELVGNATAALLLDPQACSSPDTWDPACLGECECRGYDRLLVAALLVLLPTGLAVTALLLAEPSSAAAAATSTGPRAGAAAAYLPVSLAASAEGRRAAEKGDEEDGGEEKGRSRDVGAAAAAAAVGPPDPRGWLAGLRRLLARPVAYDGISYRELPPEQAETRRLLSSPTPEAGPSSAFGDGRTRDEESGGQGFHKHASVPLASLDAADVEGDAAAVAANGVNGGEYRAAPAAAGTAPPPPTRSAAPPEASREASALTAPAAFEVSNARTADRWRPNHQALPGSPTISGRHEAAAAGDWLASARRFGGAFLHYSWYSPSTAAMCLAGATSNALTSLAWGLLLTWARDALGVPGPGRNLLTAAYSFLKGLVQLLSGAASDAAGRKAPVLVGLALNAAGLLTCACGAGWGGRLLGLGGGDATAAAQLRLVQFGYLMLGTCLMGAGAGVFYPVMPAAMVDHHRDQPGQDQPHHRQEEEEEEGGEADEEEDHRGLLGHHRTARRREDQGAGGAEAGSRSGEDRVRSEDAGGEEWGRAAGGAALAAAEWEEQRQQRQQHSMAAAMATFRFWRDLGYAVGAAGGPVADLVGVEATLVVAAAACLGVAGVVLARYEERVPVAGEADAAVVYRKRQEQEGNEGSAAAVAVTARRRGLIGFKV